MVSQAGLARSRTSPLQQSGDLRSPPAISSLHLRGAGAENEEKWHGKLQRNNVSAVFVLCVSWVSRRLQWFEANVLSFIVDSLRESDEAYPNSQGSCGGYSRGWLQFRE